MTVLDLITVLPALILCGWACLLLLVDLFIPAGQKKWTGVLALVGLAASPLDPPYHDTRRGGWVDHVAQRL